MPKPVTELTDAQLYSEWLTAQETDVVYGADETQDARWDEVEREMARRADTKVGATLDSAAGATTLT